MFLKLTPLLVGTPTPLGSRFWIFSFLHSFFFFPPCLFLFTIFLPKPRRVLHLAFPRERAPQKSEHYVFRPHPDKNTRYAWTTSSFFLPISPTNPLSQPLAIPCFFCSFTEACFQCTTLKIHQGSRRTLPPPCLRDFGPEFGFKYLKTGKTAFPAAFSQVYPLSFFHFLLASAAIVCSLRCTTIEKLYPSVFLSSPSGARASISHRTSWKPSRSYR